MDIDSRCAAAGVWSPIEWVRLSDLMDAEWVRDNVHAYAECTVHALKASGVLGHLLELFNASQDASEADPAAEVAAKLNEIQLAA